MKHRLKAGKHHGNLQPGDVIDLTERQAKNFADKFEVVTEDSNDEPKNDDPQGDDPQGQGGQQLSQVEELVKAGFTVEQATEIVEGKKSDVQ